MLVNSHLEEPLCWSKEFDIEPVANGVFKFFFDGVVTSCVEHVVDEEEEAQPLIVLVVEDKV